MVQFLKCYIYMEINESMSHIQVKNVKRGKTQLPKKSIHSLQLIIDVSNKVSCILQAR